MLRDFSLGTVLSITTGYLLCDMNDLYEIINFMTGDSLFTHQLPRAGDVCAPVLLAQHPALRTVTVPENIDSRERAERWLATMSTRLGDELPVEPLESWQHRDPLEELMQMHGGKPVIAVVLPEEGTS